MVFHKAVTQSHCLLFLISIGNIVNEPLVVRKSSALVVEEVLDPGQKLGLASWTHDGDVSLAFGKQSWEHHCEGTSYVFIGRVFLSLRPLNPGQVLLVKDIALDFLLDSCLRDSSMK